MGRAVPLQVDDIQGILLYGYGRLRHACFLLVGITDAAAARTWLSTLDVRNASFNPDETDRCLNIAFTYEGLKRLGLGDELLGDLSPEFREGMAGTEHRQRILGDVGESAPDKWRWGGARNPEPHAVLMLYGRDEGVLSELLNEQRARFTNAGLQLIEQLDTNWLPHQKEHFGFRDGVSQTGIQGFHTSTAPGNTVAAGEFLLGYLNAYGQFTRRPLVSPERDPGGLLPRAADELSRCDLGMNGSYLVFRQLSQDVEEFWRFCDEQARRGSSSARPDAHIRLASKMVGRWPSGAPLVKSPDADNPAFSNDNDFLYFGSDDQHGFKCPIGSHIRRTNPRDSLEPNPGSDRSIEVGKRHRILRRGRTYGVPAAGSMEVADILAAGDTGAERGLHFICFNTHIGRQFEFIQHTWVNNPGFDGLYEDDDPLIGDRGGALGKPAGTFTIQSEPVRTRVTGMPRFVHVRGGGYFFMPGIRAIRFLASPPAHT
jgi:Dyp-type peroxidase family